MPTEQQLTKEQKAFIWRLGVARLKGIRLWATQMGLVDKGPDAIRAGVRAKFVDLDPGSIDELARWLVWPIQPDPDWPG